MDLRKLKTLIDLVSESNVSELEITEAEGKVRIVKARPGASRPVAAPPRHARSARRRRRRLRRAPRRPRRPPAPRRPCRQVADGRHLLPLGQPGRQGLRRGRQRRSRKARPICIIEAMKILNEIEADKAGTVTRSCARTARRSNTASRCSSSSDALQPPPGARHVQEDPGRQPRRDRAAHPARLPRTRRQGGDGLFRGRPRRQVRQAGRRGGLHRPGAVGAELPQHAGDHLGRRGDRRRGHPPGYGFLSENADFAERVEHSGFAVHRPDARGDPHHGRQGLGQAGDDQGRRALRARLRRRAAGRPEGSDQARRGRSATR